MASKVPKHIAIILDGNRRYAKNLGLRPWIGHEYGIKKLEQLMEWCREIGVRELTLYCFSTENFNRNKTEVKFLFDIFKREFNNMKHRKNIFEDKIRINVIGRVGMFPLDMQKLMHEIMEKTRKHDKFTVNFALAYGGRQEIVDAVRKIAEKAKYSEVDIKEIDENLVTQNLYLQSEPEIVIRPGREMRTSNFLAWQSIYSEWIFLDKFWPEFTKKDLVNCIEEYNKRKRRFGK